MNECLCGTLWIEKCDERRTDWPGRAPQEAVKIQSLDAGTVHPVSLSSVTFSKKVDRQTPWQLTTKTQII